METSKLVRAAKIPLALICLLGALSAFAPMSIDMYLPALPQLVADLKGTTADGQGSLSAFFAGLALGQLFYGPASDRFGRRGPILLGVGLYVIASVVCSLSPSLPVLIAARFVQAFGGCAGSVVARAVVRDRFEPQDCARIFSSLTLVMGLAPILAPILGGFVLRIAGWREIFWCLAAFGGIMWLWTLLGLKESRSDATRLQAQSEHPVRAYLALLSNPALVGFALCGAFNGAAFFTYISQSADVVIGVYGISPQDFGYVFGANAAGLIGASQLNRFLLQRYSAHRILEVAAILVVMLSAVLIATAFTGFGGMWGVLVPLFFVLSTYGVMMGNTMACALAVDPLRSGTTSAIMGAGGFAAGAVTSKLAAIFYDHTPKTLALVMAVCFVLSMLSLFAFTKRA